MHVCGVQLEVWCVWVCLALAQALLFKRILQPSAMGNTLTHTRAHTYLEKANAVRGREAHGARGDHITAEDTKHAEHGKASVLHV